MPDMFAQLNWVSTGLTRHCKIKKSMGHILACAKMTGRDASKETFSKSSVHVFLQHGKCMEFLDLFKVAATFKELLFIP